MVPAVWTLPQHPLINDVTDHKCMDTVLCVALL